MPAADRAADASAPAAALVYRAGLGRRLPRGCTRIGPAISIPAVLAGFGVDVLPLCRAAGVPPETFAHPDHALPMARLGELAQHAARAIGREDFGLLVADTVNASNLGLVGFLLKQAPDARTALGDLTRYLHHTDRSAVPFMRFSGRSATFGYRIVEPDVPGATQIYDGAIAIARNIVRGLCGAGFVPQEITLSHRRPALPGRYERYFGAPVRFDTEETTLTFDAAFLDQRLPNADAELRRMLQEQIDIMEQEEQGHFGEQVRRLLRSTLLTSGGSIDDIAGLMGLTGRTFMRRLEAEGTSFRHLCDEIRFEIARQLLENTALPMTQIALALRYSEASAFSRAFRQWSGVAPRQWRVRHLSRPG